MTQIDEEVLSQIVEEAICKASCTSLNKLEEVSTRVLLVLLANPPQVTRLRPEQPQESLATRAVALANELLSECEECEEACK